ncbi:MAG: LysR substrate-binding domain-containing protein, partial [Pontibacterium sp.]
FYPVATKLLSDFDTALTDLHAMSKQAIGNISLAASPSMLSCVLPSLVADYQHHHPQVAITLRDQTASGIEKSLLNNEVDLGFGGTQLFHAELEYSPLLSDRYGVVVSRDHPFAQTANRSIKWHDMEKERLIILTTDTGIQRQIDHVLLTHEASRLQASTPAAVAALIQSGAGVSILPALAAATDAFRDLIFLPLCEPELSRTLYSIKRAGRALQPTAEGLMKKVHEEAKLTQLPTSIADYILFQEECLSGKEIPPS